ncbi:MAG TPA: antirestriction protein ArdA [Trichocoleus sp.]
MSSHPTPRIYIACLAAYNSGRLHGEWIDADQDAEYIQAAIGAMLKRSPIPNVEEWDIHDTENFASFSGHNLELISQVGKLIAEHGEGAVNGFISHVGKDDLEAQIDNFEDIYLGCFTSEANFCEEHLGEEGGICGSAEDIRVFDWATLDKYIDWEKIANDAFINQYFSFEERYENIHVYSRQ